MDQYSWLYFSVQLAKFKRLFGSPKCLLNTFWKHGCFKKGKRYKRIKQRQKKNIAQTEMQNHYFNQHFMIF